MEKSTTYLNPHEALTREDKEREIGSVFNQFHAEAPAVLKLGFLSDEEVNDIHEALMTNPPACLTSAKRLVGRALYDGRQKRANGNVGRCFSRPLAIDTRMEARASLIVSKYIREHLDKSDPAAYFEVYTVWKCKTLQNWKFLISSTLADGMYYEVTYNGDKEEWYLDAYKKFENRCIKKGEE